MKLLEIERKVRSQNGEDGIIAWMVEQLVEPLVPRQDRWFLEIGIGIGVECCTRHLADQGWPGVMVEADPKQARICREKLSAAGLYAVSVVQLRVTSTCARDLARDLRSKRGHPTVLACDIDSWDFQVVGAILAEFSVPILCVEFNSSLGLMPLALPADVAPKGQTYFGAGVTAWRRMLGRHGYEFLTVDSMGVNAFFYDPTCVEIERAVEDWLQWSDVAAERDTGQSFAQRYDALRGKRWEEIECASFSGLLTNREST